MNANYQCKNWVYRTCTYGQTKINRFRYRKKLTVYVTQQAIDDIVARYRPTTVNTRIWAIGIYVYYDDWQHSRNMTMITWCINEKKPLPWNWRAEREIVALTAAHDGIKLSIDLTANVDAVLLVGWGGDHNRRTENKINSEYIAQTRETRRKYGR